MKSGTKEIAIYEAVLELLAQGEDPHHITVQQIARAAGIGKGTVYEYFSAREEILSKSIIYYLAREVQTLEQRLNAANGFDAKLDALLRFSRASMQARVSGMKLLLENVRALEPPETMCRYIGEAGMVERLRALLREILRAGVQEKTLRCDPEDPYAMLTLTGAVFGYADPWHLLAGQEETALCEQAKRMVRAALS